jgi:hypothetical protein
MYIFTFDLSLSLDCSMPVLHKKVSSPASLQGNNGFLCFFFFPQFCDVPNVGFIDTKIN